MPDIHVWFAEISDLKLHLNSFRRLLSDAELQRADRFRFEKDRIRYTCAHGMLRRILSASSGILPQDIEFEIGQHGKPYLPGSNLFFNESDSGELIILGLARGQELGIDVEHIRPDIQPEEIADRFFSPAEVAALMALPASEREAAFFRIWTRKEAYIKATGEGLFHGLDTFDVSLEPACQDALLATRPDPAEASRWKMTDLSIHPDYAAALCIESPLETLQVKRWIAHDP